MTASMISRHRLPNRRHHELIEVQITEQSFKIGLGREVRTSSIDGAQMPGPIGEVFIDAKKPNSFVDCLASDGAILMSLLLQAGYPPETIFDSMNRHPDGSPASVLGLAARLLKEDTE